MNEAQTALPCARAGAAGHRACAAVVAPLPLRQAHSRSHRSPLAAVFPDAAPAVRASSRWKDLFANFDLTSSTSKASTTPSPTDSRVARITPREQPPSLLIASVRSRSRPPTARISAVDQSARGYHGGFSQRSRLPAARATGGARDTIRTPSAAACCTMTGSGWCIPERRRPAHATAARVPRRAHGRSLGQGQDDRAREAALLLAAAWTTTSRAT